MSTEERYNRATASSRLQVTEFPGDVDTLIAAGWVREGLGPMLWRVRAEYDAVSRDVRKLGNNDTTGMALVMMNMKTLQASVNAVGRLMLQEATRQKFMQPDAAVLALTPRVVQSFLHPQCFACDGRGMVGEYGHTSICKACSGIGRRTITLGKTDEERHFSAHILVELERKTENVARTMRRYLKEHENGDIVSVTRRHHGPQAHASQFSPPAVPVDSD